jgi:hypothetical protein
MNEDRLKRVMNALDGLVAVHEASAMIHVEPLAQLFLDNPNGAIEQIIRAYNNALNDAYTDEKDGNMRRFVEATAGGPCETIPWALYNTVGAVYPFLERSQKNKALAAVLSILDKVNYLEVNGEIGIGHTTGIREPLLLSDIKITRDYYWPGLHDEEKLWRDHSNFFILQQEIMDQDGMFRKDKVRSDFLVAYALLRKDFCSFGEDYANAANPEFLERVLQGIVALRFSRADTSDKVHEGRERLLELLPPSVHHHIEPIRQKADWADYKLFE